MYIHHNQEQSVCSDCTVVLQSEGCFTSLTVFGWAQRAHKPAIQLIMKGTLVLTADMNYRRRRLLF